MQTHTIQLLPEHIAARIAAGEVVERPASVVKELVENSLDAEATRLEITTADGGQAFIRVQDNGHGIPTAEAALAFRRHATSKLRTAADLEKIATLGFRGEALASIASVSRITCTTRHRDEPTGARLRLEAGEIVSQSASGRPPGTEMEIRDLFYNVPARRKFLRTARTERRHCDAFLTRYAIAYPQVAFQVSHDGRTAFTTPGNGDPREALLAVYGLELGGSLLEIPAALTANDPLQVRGFVGPPGVHRADRGYITLFINGRWVADLRLTYAISQAYHTLLPTGRHPVAFVQVTMPPDEVDVNVHPAKTEVRFREGDAVFRAVQRAVRATVIESAPTTRSWEAPASETPRTPQQETRAQLAALQPAQQLDLPASAPAHTSRLPQTEGNHPTAAAAPSPSARAGAGLPILRSIGQIAAAFIIAEGPDGLYLIDQHAAHERVLYEQLLADWMSGAIPSQPLLEPVTVTLPADEAAQLEGLLPHLAALGLEVEPFGRGTFLVRALPAPLGHVTPAGLLADLAAALDARDPIREAQEEALIRRICKRAAIKAGQVLTPQEIEALLDALERTQNPRTCPHGRPTVLQITLEQLARQFGRLG